MKRTLAALALTAVALAGVAAPPEQGYRSTTADYTPYRDRPVVDWRAANDAMGQARGHMGHPGGNAADRMGDTPPAAPTGEGRSEHHHPLGGKP